MQNGRNKEVSQRDESTKSDDVLFFHQKTDNLFFDLNLFPSDPFSFFFSPAKQNLRFPIDISSEYVSWLEQVKNFIDA